MSGLLADAPSALDGAGAEAHRVAGLWWFMFTLAVVVYLFVATMVVLAVLRRRRADGPESGEGRTGFIWLGGVAMPVVILGVLAFLTVSTTVALPRDEPTTLTVDVVGRQWWWDVRYPGAGIRTANEIHLPVGRNVDLRLRSLDVAHSFWVPQLAGKLDLIPGQTNHLRVRARRTGTFIGECAEFCGIQHANMRFVVVVQTPADYQRWVELRRGRRTATAGDLVAEGAAAFQRETCAGCHTIRGTQADGDVGPDLTDVGARRWLAGKAFRNTPADLRRWIEDPSTFKPGALMPASHLSDAELDALVAYLESLR